MTTPPTEPPPPFHTLPSETTNAYAITYEPDETQQGWWCCRIPAIKGCLAYGPDKHTARAEVILAAQAMLEALEAKQTAFPPSDVKDDAAPLTELAPMAADGPTDAQRRQAALAVLSAMYPGKTPDELNLAFEGLRKELQTGMEKQAKVQAASGTPNGHGGVKVRLPKGAKMAIFGGMFQITTVGKRGFTAVAINGTTINPEPLK